MAVSPLARSARSSVARYWSGTKKRSWYRSREPPHGGPQRSLIICQQHLFEQVEIYNAEPTGRLHELRQAADPTRLPEAIYQRALGASAIYSLPLASHLTHTGLLRLLLHQRR